VDAKNYLNSLKDYSLIEEQVNISSHNYKPKETKGQFMTGMIKPLKTDVTNN